MALAFLQPTAMGVLIAQGWHIYAEVVARSSVIALCMCSASVCLGLVAGLALSARAAPGQHGMRLALFWMSCTLNGGLSGIAQLRVRLGRSHANDDALFVNAFLSSGLLGVALPFIVFKVADSPGAETVLPCVLAVLVTEAICSTAASPALQVGVSAFLFVAGMQGIAASAGAAEGPAAEASAGSGKARSAASPAAAPGAIGSAASGVGGALEPFFPATVMDSRRYSPHFMVRCRARCQPDGAGEASPLMPLVSRELERGGKGGKGGRDRPARASRPPRDEARPQRGGRGPEDSGDGEAAGFREAPDGAGAAIRWDDVFEEMRPAPGAPPQAAASHPPRAPAGDAPAAAARDDGSCDSDEPPAEEVPAASAEPGPPLAAEPPRPAASAEPGPPRAEEPPRPARAAEPGPPRAEEPPRPARAALTLISLPASPGAGDPADGEGMGDDAESAPGNGRPSQELTELSDMLVSAPALSGSTLNAAAMEFVPGGGPVLGVAGFVAMSDSEAHGQLSATAQAFEPTGQVPTDAQVDQAAHGFGAAYAPGGEGWEGHLEAAGGGSGEGWDGQVAMASGQEGWEGAHALPGGDQAWDSHTAAVDSGCGGEGWAQQAYQDYGAYDGGMRPNGSDGWDGMWGHEFGTYGGGVDGTQHQTVYGNFGAAGGSAASGTLGRDGAGYSAAIPAGASELVPGDAAGQESGEPIASLIDEEFPDPGHGRATLVRRGDMEGKGENIMRTLWVGDVETWMSPSYISDLFTTMATVTNVKLGRGHAYVEFVSQSAAEAVVDTLAGEPMVTADGVRLRVAWPREADYVSMGDGGSGGRESKGDGKGDRRKGDAARGDGGWGRAKGAGGKGAEGAGKGSKARRDEGPAAAPDAEGSRRWKSKGDWNDADLGSISWAYVDPKGAVQTGFSSEEMKLWFEQGYFKKDLKIALMRAPPGNSLKEPPWREFYPLGQWFRDLPSCFTYVPRW